MKKAIAKKKKPVKASKKKKASPIVKKKKASAAKKKKAAPDKKKTKVATKKKAAPVKKKKVVAKKAAAPKAKPAKKVKAAKASKGKTKFPGYPHYPAGQDIMNKKGMEKTTLNAETNRAFPETVKPNAKASSTTAAGRKGKKKIKDDTDISQKELDFIGSDELNNDGGDDEQLKKRSWPVDMAGEDLDVPGSELDDDNEAIGEEDEENNNYSIGGDRHEDLEEDKELGQ